MDKMELKGKVIQLLPLQSGMGKKGPWKKQEFIVETQSQYPKKVCLSIWGDKVDQFNVSVGQSVTAAVELESREYNGRWYTEARAWKIEKNSADTSDGPPPPMDEPYLPDSNNTADDLPF
jgi:hypothetical protein